MLVRGTPDMHSNHLPGGILGSNEPLTEYLAEGGLGTSPLDGPAVFMSRHGGLSSRMCHTARTLSSLDDGGEVVSSVSSSSSFSSELSLNSWSLS